MRPEINCKRIFSVVFPSFPVQSYRGGAWLRVRVALQQRLLQKEDENLADVQENSQ